MTRPTKFTLKSFRKNDLFSESAITHMAETSPSWAELEKKYRALAVEYYNKSKDLLAKVNEMPTSTPSEIRAMIATSRLASRLTVQAKHFEKMANDAKRRDDKEWTELSA